MNYKELNGKTIRDGFMEFHKQNPHIYKEFEKQCYRAIKKGRKKLSSKLIINWMRWHEFIESDDKNFKINDAYHAYYSRLFIQKNPKYEGIFEFRKLRNEEETPYMLIEEGGQLKFL